MQNRTITKGNILIAQPTFNDLTFNRSVILVIEHNEHGSIGFVLNKPLKHSINMYVYELESDFQVYEGGPVDSEHIFYLHSRPDLIRDSEHIYDNVFWSGNYDDVKKAINKEIITEDEIRFFLGYSGWSQNQLEGEVNENAWIVFANEINIFQEWDANLWRSQLRKLGGEHLIWLNTPADPSMN